MSARRQARAAAALIEDDPVPPRGLLLGACVEVWANFKLKTGGVGGEEFQRWFSAWRRYRFAAAYWVATNETTYRPLWEADRVAWWLSHSWRGSYDDWPAEVDARFARAGATLADVPELREEARALMRATPVRGSWGYLWKET